VATDYGAPVHATADGIITIGENHAGYGRLVVIDHGFGITTWYAHLSSFSAVPGARVKRGEVVGYTGISGRSTGPHVHYESTHEQRADQSMALHASHSCRRLSLPKLCCPIILNSVSCGFL